jgi:RNA polymerase sigma-70 factor (ECF subfamily)
MSDQKLELTPADVAWLTALARTLTGSWPDADDLVQETWVAASTSPPKDGQMNRHWLARVLRNFYLRSWRSHTRRSSREQAVSRPEAVASTEELLERAELQKKLAESLIGLEEPYRTSLMLVVFEGFTTARLAEHQGISEVNARRRVRRGRELLREKLKRDYGHDWQHWAALLLPIARLPLPGEVAPGAPALPPEALGTGGAMAWGSGALTATAAVAVVALSLWLPSLLNSKPEPVMIALADGLAQKVVTPSTGSTPRAETGARGARAPLAEALADPIREGLGAASDSLESASGNLRVAGRVRVRDEFGALHWPSSGKLRLETAAGQTTVAVVDGAFELELPPGERQIVVRNAWLDERAAIFEQELQVGPLVSATELELEATWLPSTLLHVVDAASGTPLSNLTVVADQSSRTSHGHVFPHPGAFAPEAALASDAASPVALHPRTAYQDVYFVSAPGYSWAAFRADHLRGGERTLQLQRGVADLTLHFVDAPNQQARLRASRPGVAPFEYRGLLGTSMTLGQLAPGPLGLEVSLASGERVAQSVLLTEGDNVLWLDVTPAGAPVAAPARTLVGSIRANPGWSGGELVLRVVADREHRLPRSQWLALEDQPGAWSFELPDLQSPSALVEVLPTGWSAEVSLASNNQAALEIQLTGPIERSIHVTDAETGATLGLNHPRLEVRWSPEERSIDSHTNSATYDPAGERWSFSSIDIPIEVVVSAAGYVTQTLHLPQGARGEQQVRLERASGLILELSDGGDEVPVDVEWILAVRATNLDGLKGGIFTRAFDGVEVVYWVSRPGKFRLELPPIAGYLPMGPAEVTLLPGEVQRMPLQLQRVP